jgi:hypothetical protein
VVVVGAVPAGGADLGEDGADAGVVHGGCGRRDGLLALYGRGGVRVGADGWRRWLVSDLGVVVAACEQKRQCGESREKSLWPKDAHVLMIRARTGRVNGGVPAWARVSFFARD